MAKKRQQQQKPQPQGPPSVITNTPVKGMVKDIHAGYLDKQNWSHARNAINNSVDGDTGVVGNEPANLLCANIPYTVIGGIHLYGDKWIIYSTDNEGTLNDKSSEIGEFDDSTCTYTSLVNDDCLNFHKDHLIIGVAKENFDCSWQVYWDDGNNPSRTLNIDNIPYLQEIAPSSTGACTIYQNITPLQLECEKIRLAPLLDTPNIELTKAAEGGQLPNGMYQVFIAYSINDQIIGDYLGVSNMQSLWSYENNQGSLNVKISELDKEFEWIQVVVRTRVHNGFVSYVLGYYSTETTNINIDYLDPDLTKVKSSRLLLRNPAYEKSSGMFEVNDYLIRSQPIEQFDFNYQPLANNIKTEWVSASYPAEYYREGGNKPTFLRDEVYTFFIRFVYNTGEKSNAYHVPGRAPTGTEVSLDTTGNSWDGVAKQFKTQNTASWTANTNVVLPDGGIIQSYGDMAYWESGEKYPATDPVRYNNGSVDLCGQPIRHHKMPDENVHVTTRISTDGVANDVAAGTTTGEGTTHIQIIGAQFSNIAAPVDNSGVVIPNIVGYEMLVGNRDGNKSIIAKGIIRNMMSYERYEHKRSLQASGGGGDFAPLGDGQSNATVLHGGGPIAASLADIGAASPNALGVTDIQYGLMPNYPYNDLGIDPYLVYRGNGDVRVSEAPWLAGVFGTEPIESNWITGAGGLLKPTDDGTIHMTSDNRGMAEFTFDHHTFHSPDLNFTHMYLAPSEMVVYKTLTGKAEGNFKKSEKHPGAKLLKNKAVLIAAIIGVGYALNHMRGKRNVKINTARSQSTGETMAVGSGMTPMPGTGTAAAAVNVMLNLPGVIVGAVADMAFNTVVDVASVFGAGKLARQIGTPIYQMIETGTTGLMAGHIGPNKTIEYVGSDFTSVPTLFSMITGVLTFLNYVAIGGDKIIDLILKMVSFQDYAYKYNSHGFYGTHVPFASGTCTNPWQGSVCNNTYRHQMNTARYIKPGLQYMGGTAINNLHRPSTVVLQSNTKVEAPGQHNLMDDSKFVIGGGQCAGDGNHSLSWWTPTGIATSNIAAHYVGLKVDNDSQYGQLDSILFTPMSKTFKFKTTDPNGWDVNTKFSTGPLFGGDTYISRYTEKVTMPFWYEYMKDMPDGTPFDYRYYANVPFPRYWMNTEKYRMDEFVRPLTNLTFNFDEAFPSDMYHLDQPTTIDCDAGIIGGDNDSGGTVANYYEPGNFHLQIIRVPTSNNIMATTDNKSATASWEISGVGASQFINHPGEDCTWYLSAGVDCPATQVPQQPVEPPRKREVAIGIQGRHKNHGHSTPLIDWGGGTCISSGSDDWYDFANPTNDSGTPRKTDFDGQVRSFMALYNWNEGKFMYPVSNYYRTRQGVIGDPSWNGGNPCHHQGRCYIDGNIVEGTTTRRECMIALADTSGVPVIVAGTDYWLDSCIPEDNPKDFIYFNRTQRKKEKGWFSGTIKLDQGSFNVNGCGTDATNASSPSGWTDCSGCRPRFCRPGDENRNSGLDPDNCYRNTHQLVTKGGAPPKSSDIGEDQDSYSKEVADPNTNPAKKTGSLFVENVGYMYTHVSGINDFFVESDMNLAYRDYEDQPRKKHYDYLEYTDIHELFHADHIKGDNYYKYDKSLNTRRFWTASFGRIQERYYDPNVAEVCFTKYPKRLLYSLPSVGVHTKELQQFKRDEKADHWRTFLPENFRDFKSKVNTIVPTGKTGAIILFPTLSPQVFQGVDQLKMSDSGNKLTIGDGGLFSQAFQSITNSNVSHEYGSCESARSAVQTPSGLFYVSQAQGKIFQYAGKGIQAISDMGMKWWFNKYLPSQLLKAFPGIEDSPRAVDNPVVAAGVQSIYDPNNDIVYFAKRDYKPLADKLPDLQYLPDGRFMYSDASTQQSVEVHLTDTDYFEDISWTVSFDPKAKAWISFHDWHPELAFNSINHFLTTKKGISATPICPPGYNFSSSSNMCEILAQGSEAASVTTSTVLSTETTTGAACKLDIVIALDVSGSNTTDTCAGANAFVANFLTTIDDKMDGSIGTVTGSSDIQVGLVTWSTLDNNICDNGGQGVNSHVSKMSTASATLKAFADNSTSSQIIGVTKNGSDFYQAAVDFGMQNLNDFASSTLGDRSADPNYRRILIIVTDASSSNACTQSLPAGSTCGIDMPNDVWSVGTNAGNSGLDTETYAVVVAQGSGIPSVGWEAATDCLVQTPSVSGTPGPNQYAGTVTTLASVGTAIAGAVCDYTTCTCPAGMTLVGICDGVTTPSCTGTVCSCAGLPGYGTAALVESGTCGSTTDPLICTYNFNDSVAPNYDVGGLWRHNARTDKYSNFYGIDYPWEIDLIETSGQTVTTLRSVEYGLEAYVYKNDGRDRFHVLDFNFDQAEIYNSEQTSGLLKLNLSPKNNVPLITTYPIINASDIDILYSKEEQKYRFNQFWDVTTDRGEFSAVENTIYLTKLNGYIRDLNMANINLLKSSFERKKFRHYYNHVVLRRLVSDDKKMLLRLQNTKLNASQR